MIIDEIMPLLSKGVIQLFEDGWRKKGDLLAIFYVQDSEQGLFLSVLPCNQAKVSRGIIDEANKAMMKRNLSLDSIKTALATTPFFVQVTGDIENICTLVS